MPEELSAIESCRRLGITLARCGLPPHLRGAAFSPKGRPRLAHFCSCS
jgi:hypothetical protein